MHVAFIKKPINSIKQNNGPKKSEIHTLLIVVYEKLA